LHVVDAFIHIAPIRQLLNTAPSRIASTVIEMARIFGESSGVIAQFLPSGRR
jgi:hypothetical protein